MYHLLVFRVPLGFVLKPSVAVPRDQPHRASGRFLTPSPGEPRASAQRLMVVKQSLVLAFLFALIIANQAGAGKPRVPGLNELEVFDPGVGEMRDGTFFPAIQLNQTENGTEVEISPVVHVHRYYYNGDKEYQGPFGSGGPVIVVANHPRTRERLYIEAELPPGAPVISYDDHSITYAYPKRRVVIKFSRWCKDKVLVQHGSRWRLPRPSISAGNSKLVKAIKDHAKRTSKTVAGAAVTAWNSAGQAVETVSGLTENIPGVKALQSAVDQVGAEQRANDLKAAAEQRIQQQSLDFPTIR